MRRTPREHFEKAEKYPSQTYHCRALTGARIESAFEGHWKDLRACRALTGARIESSTSHTSFATHHGRALTGARIERGVPCCGAAGRLVAPSRARELKASRRPAGTVLCRRALTGARIERTASGTCRCRRGVAPSRARELKAWLSFRRAARDKVAPSRARELKGDLLPLRQYRHMSRPHGRAN